MPKAPIQLAEIEPLLIDAKTAAALCGVSERSWYTLIAAGIAPPSIKLSGRRLWRMDILRRWVQANCPPIDQFIRIISEEKNEKTMD